METLADKLERRHPHVFGDAPSDLPSIRTRWDEIKASERTSEPSRTADLPTLLAARKLAASLPERTPVQSLLHAADDEEKAGLEILAAVAGAWRRGIDPEIALRKVVDAVRVASGDGHDR